MALHDYRCPRCGCFKQDVNVPVAIGASNYAVYCTSLDGHLYCAPVRMEPIPAIRLSLFSDADARSSPHDFTKATVQVEAPEGGFREVTVSSLHDIRRLERESEQAERNGEGRKMCWRDYSQDGSNWDKHTLGEDPSLRPPKTYSNGTPVVVRKGDPVMSDHGTVED